MLSTRTLSAPLMPLNVSGSIEFKDTKEKNIAAPSRQPREIKARPPNPTEDLGGDKGEGRKKRIIKTEEAQANNKKHKSDLVLSKHSFFTASTEEIKSSQDGFIKKIDLRDEKVINMFFKYCGDSKTTDASFRKLVDALIYDQGAVKYELKYSSKLYTAHLLAKRGAAERKDIKEILKAGWNVSGYLTLLIFYYFKIYSNLINKNYSRLDPKDRYTILLTTDKSEQTKALLTLFEEIVVALDCLKTDLALCRIKKLPQTAATEKNLELAESITRNLKSYSAPKELVVPVHWYTHQVYAVLRLEEKDITVTAHNYGSGMSMNFPKDHFLKGLSLHDIEFTADKKNRVVRPCEVGQVSREKLKYLRLYLENIFKTHATDKRSVVESLYDFRRNLVRPSCQDRFPFNLAQIAGNCVTHGYEAIQAMRIKNDKFLSWLKDRELDQAMSVTPELQAEAATTEDKEKSSALRA